MGGAQLTGRVGATVVSDRGFGTAANDGELAKLGVTADRAAAQGHRSTARAGLEQTRPFRRMRNWRVGIEARISHLKRSIGVRRTRMRRLQGAGPGSDWAMFAYNLSA